MYHDNHIEILELNMYISGHPYIKKERIAVIQEHLHSCEECQGKFMSIITNNVESAMHDNNMRWMVEDIIDIGRQAAVY